MARYVADETRQAKAVDAYTGPDLPKFTSDKPCRVTLPPLGRRGAWPVAKEAEWDKFLRYDRKTGECGLTRPQFDSLTALTLRAHYGEGRMSWNGGVKSFIEMAMKNGLACAPWRESRYFWGLKNSGKATKARQVKLLKDGNQERHDAWIETLIEVLDELPSASLSHGVSYTLESCKAALREAAGRGGFVGKIAPGTNCASSSARCSGRPASAPTASSPSSS